MSHATIRWAVPTRFTGQVGDADASLGRWSATERIPLAPVGAVALALAYYIGGSIGFAFRVPGAPQSVMWLPNSLLLAAALIAAPRHWPLLLAAAFPAHMLVAWQADTPLPTLALLYLTNCVDAVVAATVVRLSVRGQWRMDGLSSLFVFLALGATIGPLLVSFLDAGISTGMGWADDFWASYRRRLRANTLTNIIVVPAVVGAAHAVLRGAVPRPKRTLEAIAVFGGLLLLCAMVFSRPLLDGPGWLYMPLPFLLWTAVRFGPAATSGALFVVAFVSSWYAVRGIGVFAGHEPGLNVVALQFFLLSGSVPLLCLAMVVRERETESHRLIESRDEVRRTIERVRQLAGQLISAQEEERRRIARELHDDIGQYVADVAVSMSSMKRSAAARAAGLDAEFQRLYQQTTTLFENVRELSHELHPAVLQHAGLVAATGAMCRAFAARHGIPVDCEAQDVEPVSDAVSLTTYRVVQEALTNVAKHANATKVRVTLARSGLELMVSVVDDGRGFDQTTPAGRQGLGLMSMEERVRLLHGAIEIVSRPGGTRVTASIPMEPL